MTDAINLFGRQAGLQVTMDASIGAGVQAQAVSGTFTPEEALQRLLAGTSISGRITNDGTVILSKPVTTGGAMQLGPVRVQGTAVPSQAMIGNTPPAYTGGQVAMGSQVGLLGNRDFMDTPFNQTGYTAQLIQNQQARSLADVAANDPSVRNQWSGVSYTAPLLIRGFAASNQDIAFGGLYGIAPAASVTPEYVDRVEILKGPSAMLNGMAPFGSVGGTINLVPKRAGDEPLNEVTATYASNAQFGGHVDFGRRFGEDKNIGFRFNGVYRNGNTPVDRQTQEMAAAVFGFDFRGERFRASLDYGYQKQRVNSPLRPTYVAAGVPVPASPGGRANWFQPWSYSENEDLFGTAHLEFDISPDWTLFASAGARRARLDSLMGFATITNANGNLTDAPFNFPSWSNTNTEELGIRGKVETGAIKHSLALTGTRLQLETGSLFPVIASIQSNLYSPTFIAKPNVTYLDPPKTGSTVLTSLALADVLSAADDRIQLILGGRYQRVQIGNFSSATGAMTSYYDQEAITPAVGFVVKPWKMVSFYGNYIEALQQGPTAPAGTMNTGETFPPVKSRQFELGAKVDFGRFASTLSIFQIEQPQGVTNPTSRIFSVSGQQRNQGLEWNVFGEPLPGFRALGGITLLDGVQTNTGSAATNGMKATGVPDVQLNLGAEWDAPFLRGLTFAGRVIYTSAQYLDAANTQSIPAWTRFDAGVRYTFDRADGKPIAIRFNVENVFDLNYWAAASSTYGLSNGAPRTFLLSLTSAF
ncbi:MAG: TonB-dependent receptor [Proteobacteria bacterium]|nr:TonB-dependent receptor [Pseudomonadota bacterium]